MDGAFDAMGDARSPTVVFVHGSVVTRKMWLPQLRGLSDSFRVIAPDLPGHGAAAQESFTFDAARRSLAELIRREAGGRALVAGLSLGGYVAMHLAHFEPELVSGLVLSGCSLNFTGVLGWYLKFISNLMLRGRLRQSRGPAERRAMRLFPPALADVAQAQRQAGVYPDPLGAAFAEMAGRDFTRDLAAYPGPSLILNGERDRPSRRGAARFVAAARSGRLQVVADARHACNLDQPDTYNRLVREFARSIGWANGRSS